ncbi:glutaredoxin-like protein NrdH [Erysipelotrichaceae bacterium OH741_COT-311]|nr:glutaredoxin-like protein NrdH [Erysipelotrichaceae bacterium OH741_COT-311]
MKKIIVYSKSNCMQCNFTKKFLKEHNVDFEERDVETSKDALQEVLSLGFQSLPVIVADGYDAFTGFRPDMLDQIVK